MPTSGRQWSVRGRTLVPHPLGPTGVNGGRLFYLMPEAKVPRVSPDSTLRLQARYRALQPIGNDICGRLSRGRSNWINLNPESTRYTNVMIDAMEWGIPKGHQLYELYLHNSSLWKLPLIQHSTNCHDLLRDAIAGVLEQPVLVWMDKNHLVFANIRLLKPLF